MASLALPVVTGGGLAVRAAMHADDLADAAHAGAVALEAADTAADVANAANKAEAASDGTIIYRSMKADADGLPEVGQTARTLGARPGTDIPVDTGGIVKPETGGMSVSPNDPMNLPAHRRPADMGGTGKDPVWCMSTCDIGSDLSYRPDPIKPNSHGFIEPARPMSADAYQKALESTRGKWSRVE